MEGRNYRDRVGKLGMEGRNKGWRGETKDRGEKLGMEGRKRNMEGRN